MLWQISSILGKYHICKARNCKESGFRAICPKTNKSFGHLMVHLKSVWTLNVQRLGESVNEWAVLYDREDVSYFRTFLEDCLVLAMEAARLKGGLWLLWCYELQHCMPCYKWVRVHTEKGLCTLYTELYFSSWQFLFGSFPSSFTCSLPVFCCVCRGGVGWLAWFWGYVGNLRQKTEDK